MEPVPLIIDSLCQDCNNTWKSEEWRGKCPNCGSQNINQKAIIKK